MDLRFEKSHNEPKSYRRAVYIDDQYRGMISQPWDELIQVIFDFHKAVSQRSLELLGENQLRHYTVSDLKAIAVEDYDKAVLLTIYMISQNFYDGMLESIFAKSIMNKLKNRNKLTEFMAYLDVFGSDKAPQKISDITHDSTKLMAVAFKNVADKLIKIRDEYMVPRNLPLKKVLMNKTTEQSLEFSTIARSINTAIERYHGGQAHSNIVEQAVPIKIFHLHKHHCLLQVEQNKLQGILSEVSRERNLQLPSKTLIEISKQLLEQCNIVYLSTDSISNLNEQFKILEKKLNSKKYTKEQKIRKVEKFHALIKEALDQRIEEVSRKTEQVGTELSRAQRNIFRNLWLKLSLLFKGNEVVSPDDYKLQPEVSYAKYSKTESSSTDSTFSKTAYSKPIKWGSKKSKKGAEPKTKKPPKAPSF